MLPKCFFCLASHPVELLAVTYRIDLGAGKCCSFRPFCKRFLVSFGNFFLLKVFKTKAMENGFFLTLGFVLYVPTSFRVHLALRGLLGVVSVSVTYAGLILAIEFVDGKWRTIAGMYNLFPLPVRLYEAKILCSRILKFQNNKIKIARRNTGNDCIFFFLF